MTKHSRELIQSLESDWCDALCRKDAEKLRSLVHPDFVLIGTRSSGPFTMARDEWIDAIQRREVDSIDVQVRDAVLESLMSDANPGVRIEALRLLVPVRADGSVRIVRRRGTAGTTLRTGYSPSNARDGQIASPFEWKFTRDDLAPRHAPPLIFR